MADVIGWLKLIFDVLGLLKLFSVKRNDPRLICRVSRRATKNWFGETTTEEIEVFDRSDR